MFSNSTLRATPYFSPIKKSKKRALSILAVVLLATLFLTAILANAANCDCGQLPVHETGKEFPCTKKMDGLNKLAYSFGSLLFTKGGISDNKALFLLDTRSGIFGGVWTVITGVYNVMAPLGYLLVILYLVLDIIDHTTRENLNMEFLIKITIKLFLGILIISNGMTLIETALNFSNSLINMISGGTGGGGADTAIKKALYDSIKKANMFSALSMILSFLIPYLLSSVSLVVIFFMVYSRYIEIAARAVFAPIGMASIYDGGVSGMNSSGIKYFKKFVACLLQGATMVGILVIGDTISAMAITATADVTSSAAMVALASSFGYGALGGFGVQAVLSLIIQLCVCGALIKSRSWANDLLGVT